MKIFNGNDIIWKITFHEKTFLSLDTGPLLFHICVNFYPCEKTLADFTIYIQSRLAREKEYKKDNICK